MSKRTLLVWHDADNGLVCFEENAVDAKPGRRGMFIDDDDLLNLATFLLSVMNGNCPGDEMGDIRAWFGDFHEVGDHE